MKQHQYNYPLKAYSQANSTLRRSGAVLLQVTILQVLGGALTLCCIAQPSAKFPKYSVVFLIQ